MTMDAKQEVFEDQLSAYLKGTKKQKGEILDAVAQVSGLTRKQAIRRFRTLQMKSVRDTEPRGRPVYYTPDCIAALKEVWDISSESCGENLHSQINEYIDIQIRKEQWIHDDVATFKLRKMSEGSVKKYVGQFTRTRRNFGGKSTTKKSSVLSMVPIRMDGWDTAEVGVEQVDTVAHCGRANAGDFVFTTNATDVATLWGSRRAQWNKGQEATKRSLDAMRAGCYFPWTEMHPDSGCEFINGICIRYAEVTGLRMTRSRPYHKNDNCFVEERNGHIVRAFVGYERLDCIEVVDALNELYDVLTPYLNHFVASRRIVSKVRVGAKWKVTREKKSKSPYQRILERSDVSGDVKDKLRAEHATLDPKTMKTKIDTLTQKVFDVQRKHGHPPTLSKTA